MKAIVANPTSVLHAWVEPPDDMYSVFRLYVKTLRGCAVVAVHTDIQKVLPMLERNGVRVHGAPDWCRDSSMEPPIAECDELPGGTFSLIVNGIISPALVLGLLVATVWPIFRG